MIRVRRRGQTRALIARDFAIYSPTRRGAFGFFVALLLDPGFYAALLYRLSHRLYFSGRLGRALGQWVWRWNVRATANYLSPLAEIGPGLFLPHATGVVIGEGVRLGDNVTLFQNVTLGTRSPSDRKYPIVEDDVVIFPGAVVVGDISIGRGARIGANSFVAADVGSETTVAGIPAKPTRSVVPVEDLRG